MAADGKGLNYFPSSGISDLQMLIHAFVVLFLPSLITDEINI